MDHFQENINLLFDGDEKAWRRWIESQPELDQVDILNDVKALFTELNEESEIPGMAVALERLEEVTNNYQERILDEQMALLELEMAEEELEKLVAKIKQKADRMRAYVIECILTDAPNAPEMKKMAKVMVAFERREGTYDSLNWTLYHPDND
jgi:hypothetical protein